MKYQLGISLLLIVFIFALPWLTAPDVQSPPAQELPALEPAPSAPPTGGDRGVLLRVLIGSRVQEMDMASYLAGVVRAEMPASFETEALKAQAVAARTYTLYKMENGGSPNHPQADACDDVTCCKAYRSAEAAAAAWGESAAVYEARIAAAVAETDGLCVLWEGRPILAVFHSSSPGMTRASADVWSSALPYLQSVPSPEDATSVPDYRARMSFTAAGLRELLLQALPDAQLEGRSCDWFTNIRRASSGVVESLAVGGQEITGAALRTALGLRSASFTVNFEGFEVDFTTTGYGHGVGMSQYGANGLAGEGKTFRQILSWYYTGTEVEPYIPAAAGAY